MSTDAHDGGPTASFYSEWMNETVGPLVVSVGGDEYTLDAPGPEIGPAVDDGLPYSDLLYALVGDEDGDAMLDYLDTRPQSVMVELVESILDHWALVNPPRDGMERITSEIHRYGEAIEYDLHAVLQVDMGEFARDPDRWPWSKFLRLVTKLPAGGHYSAALALDLELAEAVAEKRAADKAKGINRPDSRPSLIGWTPEVATLRQILDSGRRIEHATWGASTKFKGRGGKPPKRSPVPLVGAEVYEARRLRLQHDDIASQMLGRRYVKSTERGVSNGRV